MSFIEFCEALARVADKVITDDKLTELDILPTMLATRLQKYIDFLAMRCMTETYAKRYSQLMFNR